MIIKFLPVLAIFILVLAAILSIWKKVPSDKAAVIVGIGKPKVVTGGGTLLIPILQRMDTITLENIMFNVEIQQVKTSLGVPINASGIVVIKVMNEAERIITAVQQFNCNDERKTVETIKSQASEICKGKLREIVSAMSVEDIYDDREAFASRVQKVAGEGLLTMGLELKAFTINDIDDTQGYIAALGKEQIAKIKTHAAIAEAEAARDQQIKTSEAKRVGETAKLEAETRIAEADKIKQLQLYSYQQEQLTKQAETDAAYEIQTNITLKKVTDTDMDAAVLKEQRQREVAIAEVQVNIAQEEKGIELAQRQAERKEAELQATVVKPAEADRKQREVIAEAEKFMAIKKAEAEAETVRLEAEAEARRIEIEGTARARVIAEIGRAEAEAVRLKGLADAEALDKKAEALAKMDEAGKLQMVLQILPDVARAVAEPMSRISNISIIGGSEGGGASDVARNTVGALKAVTEALRETVGFDLTEVMRANTFEGKTTQNVNVTGIPGLGAPKPEDKEAL